MRIFAFLLVPMGLFAQPSPGSLFSPSGRLVDATRDLRAAEVGDIVTVVVADRASALAKGVTNTSRKSSANNSITKLAGTLATGTPLPNLLSLSGDQQLAGQGQTSRDMTLSTTVSARVVGVTLNGLLIVEAKKDIGVNSERQTITLSGLVRPVDVTPGNTIRSDQIADLAIKVNGKGVVGDAIKRPFILYRILLGLLPF
jgi:flagellar L-ring protein precursor FlgH